MIDTVRSLLTKGFFKSLSYTNAKRDRLAELIPADYYRQSALLPRVFPYTLGRIFQWLGNLDDVEPFYQAISEYETFDNRVCEAMACSSVNLVLWATARGEVARSCSSPTTRKGPKRCSRTRASSKRCVPR